MKCSQCQTDNTLKDRTANAGRCKNCGHPFVFEPTAMSPIKFTDIFFTKILATLSFNNTLFFTREQFFYLLERRLRQKMGDSWMGWAIAGIIITVFVPLLRWIAGIPLTIFSLWRGTSSQATSLKNRKLAAKYLVFFGVCLVIVAMILLVNASTAIGFLRFVAGTVFGVFSIYLGILRDKRTQNIVQTPIIQPDRAEDWLTRWMEVNGEPEKLLPPPQEEQTPLEMSQEVSHYSFDRALICDSDEIAQFLITNNFHFEHNCAVLSIMGYPQNIFPTVMQMLRRNPDLKVYALHNATPQGVILSHTLRSRPEWFANTTAMVYDLGITVKQALNQTRVSVFNSPLKSPILAREAKNLPSAIKETLSAEELKWLEAGNYAELTSFPPEKLLRLIVRGIADTRRNLEFSTSRDGGTWESEDISYIYISDSFG